MPGRLLSVGLSVLRQTCDKTAFESDVGTLVRKALDDRESKDLPVLSAPE